MLKIYFIKSIDFASQKRYVNFTIRQLGYTFRYGDVLLHEPFGFEILANFVRCLFVSIEGQELKLINNFLIEEMY